MKSLFLFLGNAIIILLIIVLSHKIFTDLKFEKAEHRKTKRDIILLAVLFVVGAFFLNNEDSFFKSIFDYSLKILLFFIALIGFVILRRKRLPKIQISEDLSIEEMVKRLNEWTKELQIKNLFNGLLYIEKDNEIVFDKHYGFLNFDKEKSIQKSTSFMLGDLSHTFATACLLNLIEDEKIKKESSISEYIKDFKYSEVTIENLLNLEFKLPPISKLKLRIDGDDFSPKACVKLLSKQRFEKEEINNSINQKKEIAYFILIELVEEVSTITFSEFLSDRVLKPLKMHQTFVYDYDKRNEEIQTLNESKIIKFSKKNEFIESEYEYDYHYYKYQKVYSNVNDLLKWSTYWLERKSIIKSMLENREEKKRLEPILGWYTSGEEFIFKDKFCLIQFDANNTCIYLTSISDFNRYNGGKINSEINKAYVSIVRKK